jgi:hypothetical protein
MSSPNIQYYNVFAEEKSIYHLSVEELYLYGLLNILRNREYQTITNIEVLNQYSLVKFYSRDKESKNRIKCNLLSLKKKQVIEFVNDEIDNKSLLIISFPKNLKDDSVGKGVKGFENIEIDKFNSFKSMIDHYIYFTVKRFDGLKGFKCSISRWSLILNCSEKTVQGKLDNASKNEVVFVNSGDYIEKLTDGRNQKVQDTNTYSTTPFDEDNKSNRTKKDEALKIKEGKEILNDIGNFIFDDEEEEPVYSHVDGMNEYYFLNEKDKDFPF